MKGRLYPMAWGARQQQDILISSSLEMDTAAKKTVPWMVAHVRQHFRREAPRGRMPAG